MNFRQGNKFRAIKKEYNGRVYASKGEARLAQNIDLLIKAGEIIKVEAQVPFPLFGINENQVCVHNVDFVVTLKNNTTEVWEYKGMPTDVWKLKLKLFKDNYPEIKYVVINKSMI